LGKFGSFPNFIFGCLAELVPAKRASKRKCQHYSAERLKNADGEIEIAKGGPRGPVFYEARVNPNGPERLEHSVKCALAYARSGLFPESFGSHCAQCHYREKCSTLNLNMGTKKDIMDVMAELGIEPD
jgi:hypothetical protein